MTSQHRFTNRNYRPAATEYGPAKRAAEAAGYNMNHLIRAMLRRFNASPQTELASLTDHLTAIAADTPRGRPKTEPTE